MITMFAYIVVKTSMQIAISFL